MTEYCYLKVYVVQIKRVLLKFVEEMQCIAITKNGYCCLNKSKIEKSMCALHVRKCKKMCSICYEPISFGEKLGCGHEFCRNCIFTWSRNNCPLCRYETDIYEQKSSVIRQMTDILNTINVEFNKGSYEPQIILKSIDLLLKNTWLLNIDHKWRDRMYHYVYVVVTTMFNNDGDENENKVFSRYKRILYAYASKQR